MKKKFLNLFKASKALVLIVLPNNFINRELFQDYVYNVNDCVDKKDCSVERTITSRKQLIVCNKWKFKLTFLVIFLLSNQFYKKYL
jgi:hypothetical protein